MESLLKSISTLLDNHPISPIYLINLSKNCTLHKKKALYSIKALVLNKFSKKLEIFIFHLSKYNEIKEDSCYNSFALDEDLVLISSFLESLLKTIEILCKCLFPLNINSYFLDRRMPYLEKMIKKLSYRKLKENFKSIENFIRISLQKSLKEKANREISSVNENTDVNINRSNANTGNRSNYSRNEDNDDRLRFLLTFLKTFNLRSKVLKNSADSLISSDLSVLRPLISDFHFVSKYFQNQKYVYPAKFHNKIEKTVLNTLYSDFSISRNDLVNSWDSLYYVFCRASLKERLLEAFLSLLENEKFVVKTYEIAKKISEKDLDFERCFKKYLQSISESELNCKEISTYINDMMHVENVMDEDQCLALMKIVAEIVQISKDPEMILQQLQQKLAFRILINRRNHVNLLNREIEFLNMLNRAHSENMMSMIKDNKDGNLLLMKMCKWPIFSTENITDFSSEITMEKQRISDELKEKKRRVSWVDALCTVKVLMFGRLVDLSLFQYFIVSKLASSASSDIELANNEISGSNEITSARNDIGINESAGANKESNSASSGMVNAIKFNNLDIPKAYENQFKSLLNDLVIIKDSYYVLNPLFKNTNFLTFDLTLAKSNVQNDSDCSYNKSAYNQSRISKFLKKLKKVEISQILEEFKGNLEGNLDVILKDLESKGICEIKGSEVSYCP